MIGCIYKHPKLSIEEFNNKFLSSVLEKISFENKEIYLLSDFNINILNYESDRHFAQFLDDMYSNCFIPYITLPTCITPRSKTLIDNIFYNNFDDSIISGNIITNISDHLAQFLINPKVLENEPKKLIYKRCFKNFNEELFENNLKTTNWEAVFNLNLNDVNFSFGQLIQKINELLDIHVPYKYFKPKLKKHNKPWTTCGLATSIKKKNNLNKFCRAKDSRKKEELHILYKAYKNLITNLSRRSKESHFKYLLEENKRNSFKIWQIIKEVININSQSRFSTNCLKIKDALVTDKDKIANEFNNFFNSIASKIDSKIVKTESKFHDSLNNPNEKTFFLNPTTAEEIEDHLKWLNGRKAVRINSIPTKILKTFKKTLSQPLAELFNLVFSTGTFPDACKIAEVIPLYKKDSNLECNNYCPISLLSNIGKIIEKRLHERLYSFLEQNNCIYDLQFGFRALHSTNHTLISISKQLKSSLDKNNFACGVFLDFQKAFDTVNQKILLSKLSHYGIRGIPHKLFYSYLNNRKQYTSIDDDDSAVLTITHGVPQGSVLGPLLFLIYINDLHNVIKHASMYHFANDTNLLYSNSSLKLINKYINHDLKLIVHSLRASRISLNVSKTEIVLFRRKNKKIKN